MNDADFLLTDEYADYMAKISKLHASKKTREEEMRRLFDEFKEEMSGLEDEAKEFHSSWEQWKSQQGGDSEEEETTVAE